MLFLGCLTQSESSLAARWSDCLTQGDQTHSLGAPFELWVHLFNLGSTTQIGEDSVTISADVHVGALRKAIIHEFPDTAGGEANKLVVKPTLGGEALTPLTTKLSAVKFHLKDDGFLHAYVAVPPKTEGAAARLSNASFN